MREHLRRSQDVGRSQGMEMSLDSSRGCHSLRRCLWFPKTFLPERSNLIQTPCHPQSKGNPGNAHPKSLLNPPERDMQQEHEATSDTAAAAFPGTAVFSHGSQ